MLSLMRTGSPNAVKTTALVSFFVMAKSPDFRSDLAPAPDRRNAGFPRPSAAQKPITAERSAWLGAWRTMLAWRDRPHAAWGVGRRCGGQRRVATCVCRSGWMTSDILLRG